jgi:hypothetical protein
LSASRSVPVEDNAGPVFDSSRRRHQTKEGEAGEALAASGFADERQRFAPRDAEAHAIDR